MLRSISWLLTTTSVVLLSITTALAAPQTGAAEPDWVSMRPSSPAASPLRPPAEPSLTELRPVQLSYAPTYGLANTALLTAGSQSIGFQTGGRTSAWGNRHVQWAVYGAVIGAVVGLIDENPFEKALIGGAVGFGLSYVISR